MSRFTEEEEEDMKPELQERARDEDYNKAERMRKAGLRTQPKPGEPGFVDRDKNINKEDSKS